MRVKRLKDLLRGIADTNIELEIAGVSVDSREDLKGKLFIAYAGVERDAHEYVTTAIAKGALVVVGEKELDLPVPYFQVSSGRLAWAKIMANWYDNPQESLFKIGVTGTDGKTTTSTLIYEILKESGIKVGLLSTVSAKIFDADLDTGFHVTSPNPDEFFKILRLMVDRGLTHAVLEVTSHALDQYRYGDMDFEIGVLTNITHEHLDYHKTFENYRDAKLKLFKGTKYAVLNQDDPSFDYFREHVSGEVVPYTKSNLKTNLIGEYNQYNLGAAEAVAKIIGVPLMVRNFNAIPGRMEEIKLGQKFRAIVDFAHTPNALEKVLTQLRSELPKGKKLILVFGCAGLRDSTKRPLMGKIAVKLADQIIVTAEDPRTEKLDDIYLDITVGSIDFIREDDRQQAINKAVSMAGADDIVLVTGKGHEKSMSIGGTEHPWSDVEAIKKALGIASAKVHA